MICLSIGNTDFDSAIEHLKGAALAEIRIDLLSFSAQQLRSIFSHHKNIIATCRAQNYEGRVASAYYSAIDAGCAYIDVDIDEADAEGIISYAKSRGCGLIISYHNFEFTPSSNLLEKNIEKIMDMGADIAKLACMANSADDCNRVLNLYDSHPNIVAFCMGDLGRKTRLLSLLLGAPFSYASMDNNKTAPGQISFDEMRHILL